MRAEALGGSPFRKAELKIHMTHGGQERLRSSQARAITELKPAPQMSGP